MAAKPQRALLTKVSICDESRQTYTAATKSPIHMILALCKALHTSASGFHIFIYRLAEYNTVEILLQYCRHTFLMKLPPLRADLGACSAVDATSRHVSGVSGGASAGTSCLLLPAAWPSPPGWALLPAVTTAVLPPAAAFAGGCAPMRCSARSNLGEIEALKRWPRAGAAPGGSACGLLPAAAAAGCAMTGSIPNLAGGAAPVAGAAAGRGAVAVRPVSESCFLADAAGRAASVWQFSGCAGGAILAPRASAAGCGAAGTLFAAHMAA